MKKKEIRYFHYANVHNFKAAIEIVPFLINLFHPKSVIDVGCGIGTWLKIFNNSGIKDILGIDGSYVDKNSLKIDVENFIEYDLECPFISDRKFDLAISLEVAEHLKTESSDIFVKTLSELSDVIIFSAAIPNQGGQNHINEQEPCYWIEKFEDAGFKSYDVLRPLFWGNGNIEPWYSQNMFIFSKNPKFTNKLILLNSFLNAHLVHPGILKMKETSLKECNQQITEILKGKRRIRFYIILLIKTLIAKLNKQYRALFSK